MAQLSTAERASRASRIKTRLTSSPQTSSPQTAPSVWPSTQRDPGKRAYGLEFIPAHTQVRSDAPIQLKGGKDKVKGKAQEKSWKDKIAEHGFASVEGGEDASANADIVASDERRLWLFEVKGANLWQSKDNVQHDHNVPAKQLAGKLSGKLKSKLRVPSGAGSKQQSVEDYILNAEFEGHARDQLLLGTSNVDINDALLGLRYDASEEDGSPKGFDFKKGASLPLSISSVLNYLRNASEDITDKDKREDYQDTHEEAINELEEEWGAWRGDGRSFFLQDPSRLTKLENAYTALRRTNVQQTLHGQLATIGDEIEYKFLPVVKDLQHVEKPEQDRRDPTASKDFSFRRSSETAQVLPSGLAKEMGRAFRTDLSRVRVHEGMAAPMAGAVAFASGNDIHFAPGKYNPASTRGRELIAHELAHVTQQRSGRVSLPAKGVVQESPALELEANRQAARVVRGETATPGTEHTEGTVSANSSPVQRTKFGKGEALAFLRRTLAGPIDIDDYDAVVALLPAPYNAPDDVGSNYNALYEAYTALQAEHGDVADFVSARDRPKLRPVSAEEWRHIADGEIRGKVPKQYVVGYHWKGLGDAAAAEGVGAVTDMQADGPNAGVYKQSVRQRGGGAGKADPSTFFPDDWTEADVRMSIEYAAKEGASGSKLTVTLPVRAAGMVLFHNADGYFPFLE